MVLRKEEEDMQELHNYLSYKPVRKLLRNNPTQAEKLLWSGLKDNRIGFKFRRQQSIGNYVADFYCAKLKLVVEVDGATHNEKTVKEKDKILDYRSAVYN